MVGRCIRIGSALRCCQHIHIILLISILLAKSRSRRAEREMAHTIAAPVVSSTGADIAKSGADRLSHQRMVALIPSSPSDSFRSPDIRARANNRYELAQQQGLDKGRPSHGGGKSLIIRSDRCLRQMAVKPAIGKVKSNCLKSRLLSKFATPTSKPT